VQKGPPQADRGTAAQPLRIPAASITDGDVNTLILVIALLVGNLCDQFLVDATLDIGQIDCLHGQTFR
jgi:hypothetical protein